MIREFSAGGVIFNDSGEVLLIKNAALRDPSKAYWGFPKGHIETGESSSQAALREVLEETGIEADIVQRLGESKYVYISQGQKIFKVVVMFWMKYKGGELVFQREELLGAEWFDAGVALEKLSFSNDKYFLKKALELELTQKENQKLL